jgi:hypothetical protein
MTIEAQHETWHMAPADGHDGEYGDEPQVCSHCGHALDGNAMVSGDFALCAACDGD